MQQNLIPLQSRLLALVVAICLFLALPTAFTPRYLVCAAELVVVPDHDGLNQPALHAPMDEEVAHTESDNLDMEGSGGYAPAFAYLDRSLIGRQADDVQSLTNNVKMEMDISPGATVYFAVPKGQSNVRRSDDAPLEALDALGAENASGEAGQREETDVVSKDNLDNIGEGRELKKRQGGTVYISANTCRQPTPSVNGTAPSGDHPQLVMYVSTSPQEKKPGPGYQGPTVLFDTGYASYEAQASGDVYIGISAPNLDNAWFGSWHFEIAASIDRLYHNYDDDSPFLDMIDTDSESALFITPALGKANDSQALDSWNNQNPFKMYVFPAGNWTQITGLEHSYCALTAQFNMNSTKNFTVDTTITTRFLDKSPKSQFHVKGLDAATTYNGFLVVGENQQTASLPDVGIVSGGGMVFQQFNWTTKVDDSCQVIFDLDFCDSVAYAVPSSLTYKLNDTGLKDKYDSNARDYYQNFSRSLAQVACDAPPESQYSLAQTCKDCETNYKNWLCSVLIPRCEDWTANDAWLQPRNINVPFANGSLTFGGNVTKEFNQTYRDRFSYSGSRNPLITNDIMSGPYKELLPCEDLCFDIVRSCPAKLGFACPNSPARELSYGKRDPADLQLMCNFPGAVVKLNVQGAASSLSMSLGSIILVAVIATGLLLWE